MTAENRWLALAIASVLALVIVLFSVRITPARDAGQWHNSPAVSEWYRTLMQPDNPVVSCCGEADAYWADEIHVRDGKVYASITDDRPDAPRGRPHRDIGEEFEIPPNKLKFDSGNPDGHAIIFLSSPSAGGYVYCFVQGTGG